MSLEKVLEEEGDEQDPEDSGISRRQILKYGAAATAFSALSWTAIGAKLEETFDNDQPDNRQQPGAGETTTSPEETPEPIPEIQIGNVQDAEIEKWSPEMQQLENIEQVPKEHKGRLKIENTEQYDQIEVKVNGQNEEITEAETLGIVPTLLETGNNNIQLTATKNQQQTNEQIQIQKQVPETHPIQITQNQQTQTNYQTPYHYDNFQFQPERINSKRQEWLETEAYNGTRYDRSLIQLLEENNLEENSKVFQGRGIGTLYPNADDESYGHWDLNSFKEEQNFQNIMSWVQSPIRTWQQLKDGGAPSTENDIFAATEEVAVEQLHPLFNGEQENYDLRAGFISTQGYGEALNHGVCHVYADTPNMEEINGQNLDHVEVDEEIRWWIVDTTTDEITPAWESSYREGGPRGRETTGQYNPIARGYKSGETTNALSYEEEKLSARAALTSMVKTGGRANVVEFEKFHINDEFLEDAYNHIQNNKKIEPIIEPLEQAIDLQMKNDDYVGISGSMNDYRIERTDEEIYQEVMKSETSVSKEEIREMMQPAE